MAMERSVLLMSLLEEYRKQFLWRDWDMALSTCPIQPGQHVLDLGCGVGDLSRELAQRGAIVTGVDGNAELLQFAREQNYSNCTFVQQDLSSLRLNQKFSGLWCSFTAAYFTNFAGIFDRWLTLSTKTSRGCLHPREMMPIPCSAIRNFMGISVGSVTRWASRRP